VADQLGPGKLRGVPPEWGVFVSLAALVATALAPVYRQVQTCSRWLHIECVSFLDTASGKPLQSSDSPDSDTLSRICHVCTCAFW
jgi:hypothetical protein